MTTFLESKEDLKWLSDVHYKAAILYACAILHGNEDAPSKVELFARNHFKCKPTILEANDSGNLVVTSYGMKPKDQAGQLGRR
jgi:hypothetical protein